MAQFNQSGIPGIDTRIVENANGQAMVSPSSVMPDGMMLDRDWAKIAFMTPSNAYSSNTDSVARFYSTASMKFTSAVIGGSVEINPRPQFTRYADVRSKGVLPNRNDVSVTNVSGNYGMGRYYSEAFDDNAQKIFMRFGVPQYNSLVSFLLNAADYGATQLARTGRISKLYIASKAISSIAMFVAYPGLTAGIYLYKGLSALLGTPTSKYYTMKPTMHTYWSAVNTLVNQIGVAKGLFPMEFLSQAPNQVNGPGELFNINAGVVDANGNVLPNTVLSQISRMLPGLIDSHGYFDVFAIAARPQTKANQLFDYVYQQKGVQHSISGNIAVTTDQRNNPDNTNLAAQSIFSSRLVDQNTGFFDFVNRKVLEFKAYFGENTTAGAIEGDPRAATSTTVDPNTQKASNGATIAASNTSNAPTKEGFGSFLEAEFQGGASFAIFQVDYTGPVSESFSNSVVESELSEKINTTSSASREAKFNMEDGSMVGGAVGAVVGAAASGIANVLAGTLDGVTFGYGSGVLGALGILAGNGFIDIPKHWQSSTASLPRSTYNIELISPYGNVISQMINIYIPLSMLLAGALPLATGKQSYTSPFLVQLFDRGRNQIQSGPGMIESLSVTRGTSNLGFTNLGAPLAVKVSFNVVDLSSIMSMPLSTGGIFNLDNTSGDNIINDYIAVLAGQDIYSQIYALPRLKMNVAKAINSAKRFASPAYWASFAHNATTAGALSFFPIGQLARGIEGISRGSSLLNPISGSN